MNKEVFFRFGLGFDLIIDSKYPINDTQILKHIKTNPKKSNEYRAPPFKYYFLKDLFESLGFTVTTEVLENSALSERYRERVTVKLQLRDYQKEALFEFTKNNHQGIVILPTAAGKTVIALKAIEDLQEKTLIIVPTKNLLQQWMNYLAKYTSLTKDMIGQLGDQVREIKEITVTTYDSARLNIPQLRKSFNFLIFDEAHHSAAKETIKVLEGLPAKHRLGLTATPERSDKGEELLFKLIGQPIRVAKVASLVKGGYVADYELITIKVPLEEEEREQYDRFMETYRGYLRAKKIQIRSPSDYQRYLIFRVNQDERAKRALDAHQKARNLVFSSKAKIKKIQELLIKHQDDQVIIFSEFNDIVYEVSKKYLLPAITHETKSSEREKILSKFSRGEYSKIVTGKVLDEGWDCGNVNVGIVVSGTGQARQFIQRLGRILRPKEGNAILYELVTPKSLETSTLKRRRKSEVV
ncbi:MAG: DEAD/DEAH box helicase [Candidatus Heimdallarchaeaceae archaeon]